MLIRYLVALTFCLVCSTFAQPAVAQEIVDSISSPGNAPRGLTWDGDYLWCADATTDSVYKLDVSDGSVISSFAFSIESSYGGITWSDDDNMWIANGALIYKVNPADGGVLGYFSCPGG